MGANDKAAATYHPDEIFAQRNKLWETRDACPDHYPKPCPDGCPNKGKET